VCIARAPGPRTDERLIDCTTQSHLESKAGALRSAVAQVGEEEAAYRAYIQPADTYKRETQVGVANLASALTHQHAHTRTRAHTHARSCPHLHTHVFRTPRTHAHALLHAHSSRHETTPALPTVSCTASRLWLPVGVSRVRVYACMHACLPACFCFFRVGCPWMFVPLMVAHGGCGAQAWLDAHEATGEYNAEEIVGATSVLAEQ
jgi:hypothetical protein